MIKKTIIALSSLAIGLSSLAQAQLTQHPQSLHLKGGFINDNQSGHLVNVVQAKKLKNNSWVSLKGYIISQVKGDHYEFKDKTGSIQVEIDDDVWQGLTISPTDLVVITGEVEQDWRKVKIDVKQIQKKAP